jgi:hypothetical protein
MKILISEEQLCIVYEFLYWILTRHKDTLVHKTKSLLARIHTKKTKTKSTRTQKHLLTVDTATAGQRRTNP